MFFFLPIHLTGVSCLFSSSSHFVKSCISFQPECCPNLFFLVPCLSRFNQSGSNSFLSIVLVIHSFATSKVQMVFLVSIFLPQCSQLCSTPLCSFFQLFNLSRFFGFTLLSKKQLSFTSSLPLPFLSGAILDLGTRSSCSGGVL